MHSILYLARHFLIFHCIFFFSSLSAQLTTEVSCTELSLVDNRQNLKKEILPILRYNDVRESSIGFFKLIFKFLQSTIIFITKQKKTILNHQQLTF